ncbi:MAG: alpha-1,4-glucan--maltose-1-phosphate maltosyltransferase [Candidatus Binatia bacterium]
MVHENVQARVVISGVMPEIEGGRFPVKRTVGEKLVVEADIFVDGHDLLSAVLLHRAEAETQWREAAMHPLVNDRWRGEFRVTALGVYHYTLQAWVDRFTSWREGFRKKVEANQDVKIDILVGAELLETAARRATGEASTQLQQWAIILRQQSGSATAIDLALADDVAALVAAHPDRRFAVTYERELQVVVEQEKARFSAWYEMFPRSCAPEPGKHGTFADCEKRLPYVAAMGFDVLYLPPIHPIGRAFRKGKNNTLTTTPEDPGSTWAIGATEGGHKAIHPQLGTLEDFRRLVSKTREYGIELALDIAYQCTPDHPYVKEHPEWFRHRPDGSIQYAENPPKKYQDIYPIDFETEDWQALWKELKSIVEFWIDQGVRIFRVDNPHTKSFRFWEWMITDIRKSHPDVLFLSEAFTRPKVRYRLAKLGFSQSYTYFAWRNTKDELTQYLTELTQTEVREYFRPNLWPNTPDILTEYLQFGGRPAFISRLVLAATLGSSYGIYGPAFELCENRPREAGSEEYLNSEKYEIRHWDLDRPDSLKEIIGRVNRIRRENPALHRNEHLRFHPIDNDQLICYSKHSEDSANVIVVVVNLDPHHTHTGWMELALEELGLTADHPYQVHDLLSEARYLWHGSRNYIQLNPQAMPAHVFRIRRRVRTERDFDYYM